MRLHDWDVRLARWANARLGEPYVWGQLDCALLCFEAFERMTGIDVASRYREQWSSRASAEAYQVRNKTNLTLELASLGCESVPVGFQQRGDFVLVERVPFNHGYVCFGDRVLCAMPEDRVIWLTLNYSVPEGMHVLRVPA